MKIDNINRVSNVPNNNVMEEKKVNPSKKEKIEPAAVYEKSKAEEKTHVYDRSSIERLKKESDSVYGQLRQMVEDMLKNQGRTFGMLRPGEMVNIDGATRAEAQKMIGDDGPLGIEAMSDTIVDFAKSISGGNKEKLDSLRGAIEKGFRAAERILGQLPEISQKTYDRIMEKLDVWEKEES